MNNEGGINDGLRSTLDDIEQWLEENNMIAAHSGLFDRKTMPNALWGGVNQEWKSFLNSAKRTGSELVWVEVEQCSVVDEEELGELFSLAQVDFKSDFLKQVASLRKFEGAVASFYLYWAYRGVLNAFIADAAWIDEYHDYQDRLKEVRQAAQRRLQLEEREREEKKRREEFQRKAKRLLQHPKYGECQNRNDRIYLAKEIFGPDINARQLVMQAETLARMES